MCAHMGKSIQKLYRNYTIIPVYTDPAKVGVVSTMDITLECTVVCTMFTLCYTSCDVMHMLLLYMV